jgi:hypothetical protein
MVRQCDRRRMRVGMRSICGRSRSSWTYSLTVPSGWRASWPSGGVPTASSGYTPQIGKLMHIRKPYRHPQNYNFPSFAKLLILILPLFAFFPRVFCSVPFIVPYLNFVFLHISTLFSCLFIFFSPKKTSSVFRQRGGAYFPAGV